MKKPINIIWMVAITVMIGLLLAVPAFTKIDFRAARGVSDTAYNATTWDGVIFVAPSKNAVRDILETIPLESEVPLDSDFASSGIMERTGAGTYGIATAGTDFDKPGTIPAAAQRIKAPAAFVDADGTPNVSGGNHFYTASTAGTITDTTIAFVDSNPDTITDSNDGFVAGGFVAGMSIDVTGTTNNNTTYTIATVVVGTITLIAGDTVTAEGAGNSFTIAGYTTITMFDGGTAGDFFKLEIRDANTKVDFTGTNLIGNYGNDVKFNNGEWLTANFDGTNWECDVYHNKLPVKELSFPIGADAMSDDTYHGITLSGRNAGETTVQWDCLYWDAADSEWKIADNTGVDTSTSPDVFKAAGAMGVAAGADGSAITVLIRGVVRNDGWNWTAGKPVYLSAGGDMTQTRPTSASAFPQEVGMAKSDDEIYFDPQPIDWGVLRGGTHNDDKTLNAIEATSTIWTITVTAKTFTLPLVLEVPTINTTIIAVGAIEIHVDPNVSDRLMHDGVANADGHKATSLSAAGDQITIAYYDADGPIAQSNSWTAE